MKINNPRVMVRILLSLTVVLAGIGAMVYFSSQKKKPHRAGPQEMVLQVRVEPGRAEQVQTQLSGFGVARPLTIVRLSAEVGGKLVYVHPEFRTGKTIAKGETIFRIDPSDYKAALENLQAMLSQKEAALIRVKTEYTADKKRLAVISRTRDLARDEYERVRVLLEENSIGNRSAVDQAEQSMNSAVDSLHQMKRALALYPVQLKEAQAAIESVKADIVKARANLDRCMVTAPFTGRVKSRQMEMGEYASPGKEVLTLADDSRLEILVSLDAKEVSAWLEFTTPSETAAQGWFPKPVPVEAKIQWIEAKDHLWTATLSRLVEFDQSSRTMTLAVEFDPSKDNCSTCPPLVEGMFCNVTIPGKRIENLFRVKRWLVTTDNTLYLARDNRLTTRKISRVYSEGDWLFVKGDISSGDLIITTRLVDPLENSRLEIIGDPRENSGGDRG